MERKNKITAVLGKKGFGKTTYVVSQTAALTRLIIFDYNREYEQGRIISTPQELINQLRLNQNTYFRLIYRPSPVLDIHAHFDFFSKICFEVKNYTLVIEEVDLVSSAGNMPEGLKKIINYGRHHAINLLALSRRAHMVPRDLTANADSIVTFNQQEPRDIRYLADYFGGTVTRKTGEALDAESVIQSLKRVENFSEFLEWENGNFRFGKINFVDKRISF